MIKIQRVNMQETARYLGNKNTELDQNTKALFDECEKELLDVLNIRYIYKTFDLNGCDLLQGEDIKEHLKNCSQAVVMCATLGAKVNNLIRKYEVMDMAKAVVIDAMASCVIEEVMDKIEVELAGLNLGYNLTWRFSPGYGDYPIALQEKYLQLLDAPRKIGLCTTDTYLLTPTKSVTAIVGLSKDEIQSKRRGCATCNLVQSCEYRKAGKRCDN